MKKFWYWLRNTEDLHGKKIKLTWWGTIYLRTRIYIPLMKLEHRIKYSSMSNYQYITVKPLLNLFFCFCSGDFPATVKPRREMT